MAPPVGSDFAGGGVGASLADRPSLSIHAPAAASPRSSTSTPTINPQLRRGCAAPASPDMRAGRGGAPIGAPVTGTPRPLFGIRDGSAPSVVSSDGTTAPYAPGGVASGEGVAPCGALGRCPRGPPGRCWIVTGAEDGPGIGAPGIGAPGIGTPGIGAPGIGPPARDTGAGPSRGSAPPGIGVAGITGAGAGAGAAAATGTGAGVTCCARGCTGFAPVSIFCVGASRLSPAESRAPHPPQNREFGSLWVPQLGQRIPAQA